MDTAMMTPLNLITVEKQPATHLLRPLAPFEELFWLLDQSSGTHMVVTAEITGQTTVKEWRRSLDTLRQRHP
jgi:hypothetical protein